MNTETPRAWHCALSGLRRASRILAAPAFTVATLIALAPWETVPVAAQVEIQQRPLYVISANVWDSPVIRVCFEQEGFDAEKAWARAAIAASWEAASNVRFTGWKLCTGQTSSGLRVLFHDAYGESGYGKELNNKEDGVKLNTWGTDSAPKLCFGSWPRERCVRSTAVHEFGHALGFAHEQNRSHDPAVCSKPAQGANGDVEVGPFDLNSVMNYCNAVRNGDGRLSPTDVAGVRQFYGWSGSNAYPLNSSDLRTDFVVWRPTEGKWYERDLDRNSGRGVTFGISGDIPVGMDTDGDGRKDLVVWRPAEGKWYRKNRIVCWFSGGFLGIGQAKKCSPPYSVVQWGTSGDIPVAADYDGDGVDDYAVWRPSEGNWYVINSSSGVARVVSQRGLPGDIPVPADYDGDGRADFAIWRPSKGHWYVINSTRGASVSRWGLEGDIPVPGDYDHDGRADFAVWRPSEGNWYVINSSSGARTVQQWGQLGDIPVPADYDNDGQTDLAIWRPSEGSWYWVRSSDRSGLRLAWGLDGDVPIGSRPN